MSFCQGCLDKQRKIDELFEENQRLKAQLRYRQRKLTDGLFGSSTPSAQRPVKANSEADHQAKSGGAPIDGVTGSRRGTGSGGRGQIFCWQTHRMPRRDHSRRSTVNKRFDP